MKDQKGILKQLILFSSKKTIPTNTIATGIPDNNFDTFLSHQIHSAQTKFLSHDESIIG